MGVNAQTSVPAFTAGQVLTAAQQTQINTGIPVFATTVTRDAAFGGAGEKVLALGQYAFIEATSTLQVYNGSAWVSAITSGLNLVTAQTIGSAVGSVAVTSVFSSTYDNYKIIINGGVASATGNASIILGATVTGYYAGYSGVTISSATAAIASDNNAASWSRFCSGSANSIFADFDLLAPNMAKYTGITGIQSALNADVGRSGVGWLQNATQYTGFTITPDSGTLTGGTIYVYGYAKA